MHSPTYLVRFHRTADGHTPAIPESKWPLEAEHGDV
jgi:hypothetical protein